MAARLVLQDFLPERQSFLWALLRTGEINKPLLSEIWNKGKIKKEANLICSPSKTNLFFPL